MRAHGDTRHRATAVILKDDKVLLFHRIKLDHDYYVFPGGGVEEVETVEEALKREIKEELGLEIVKFAPLFDIENLDVPDWATIHIGQKQCHHYFLVKDYKGNPTFGGPEKEQMDEHNQYHIVWLGLGELKTTSNIFPREGVINLLTILHHLVQLS